MSSPTRRRVDGGTAWTPTGAPRTRRPAWLADAWRRSTLEGMTRVGGVDLPGEVAGWSR